MFDIVAVGVDDYEAGRDALELAKQLGLLAGDMLLGFVEAVMGAPGPDTDPEWHPEVTDPYPGVLGAALATLGVSVIRRAARDVYAELQRR